MRQHGDFSFYKKNCCKNPTVDNFLETDCKKKKASPPRLRSLQHTSWSVKTAACYVYADDDVIANGAAAKAGVLLLSARSRRTTWGHEEEEGEEDRGGTCHMICLYKPCKGGGARGRGRGPRERSQETLTRAMTVAPAPAHATMYRW